MCQIPGISAEEMTSLREPTETRVPYWGCDDEIDERSVALGPSASRSRLRLMHSACRNQSTPMQDDDYRGFDGSNGSKRSPGNQHISTYMR
jgi:hypothetical protein